MAHELEIINGKAQFAYTGAEPWHGLGTKTENVMTAKEALELAGLDWTVNLKPVSFLGEDGLSQINVPDRYAAVRSSDNKPLGVVGGSYHVFNNAEAFEFFDQVVGTGEAKYETAGSLKGGSRVFMTAKVGDTFNIAGEDAHDMYLLITNSHDGTRSLQAAVTTVRAVCSNTVSMGLRAAKSKWSLRHKSSLAGKVAEARDALQMSFKYQEEFEKEVQQLMQIEVDKDQFLRIVEGILPEQKFQKEKNRDMLMNIFENESTVIDAPGAGTGWGALNAVTFWNTHMRPSRTDEARFLSLTEGKAFQTANDVKNMILASA